MPHLGNRNLFVQLSRLYNDGLFRQTKLLGGVKHWFPSFLGCYAVSIDFCFQRFKLTSQKKKRVRDMICPSNVGMIWDALRGC